MHVGGILESSCSGGSIMNRCVHLIESFLGVIPLVFASQAIILAWLTCADSSAM